MKEKKYLILLQRKIETRSDALKTIKETSYLFLIVAAFQAIIGYFLMPGLIIDSVIIVLLAVHLLTRKVRVPAVLLLLITGIELIVTILNGLGITNNGGTNVFLAGILFLASIRAVEATFKLHGKLASESVQEIES